MIHVNDFERAEARQKRNVIHGRCGGKWVEVLAAGQRTYRVRFASGKIRNVPGDYVELDVA